MKLKYEFCFQPMGDIVMAVAVGDNSRDSNCMIKLNDVGHFIVSQMQEDITEEQIVSKVLDAYEVDEATAAKSVHGVIAYLKEEDVLDV